MSKTFTCQELGGICDQKFSGNSLMEIVQKSMPHMASDEAHKEHMQNLASSGESREQWFERMQQEFDDRPRD